MYLPRLNYLWQPGFYIFGDVAVGFYVSQIKLALTHFYFYLRSKYFYIGSKSSINGSFMTLFLRLSCIENSIDKVHPHETHFIVGNVFLSLLL